MVINCSKNTNENIDENNSYVSTFKINLLREIKYSGCIESLTWMENSYEFCCTVRNDSMIRFYNAQTLMNDNNMSLIIPATVRKINTNPFGDRHVSFDVGFMCPILNNQYLLGLYLFFFLCLFCFVLFCVVSLFCFYLAIRH